MWILPWIKLSWHIALCETNLDDSTDSGNFSVRCYLPLIWKDFVTHKHGLAVYMKDRLPFAQDLSLESSADSYLYLSFRLALLRVTSFSSFDHLIRLYVHFLMLFNLTYIRFFQSTYPLVCLSLKTLTSITRTG